MLLLRSRFECRDRSKKSPQTEPCYAEKELPRVLDCRSEGWDEQS